MRLAPMQTRRAPAKQLGWRSRPIGSSTSHERPPAGTKPCRSPSLPPTNILCLNSHLSWAEKRVMVEQHEHLIGCQDSQPHHRDDTKRQGLGRGELQRRHRRRQPAEPHRRQRVEERRCKYARIASCSQHAIHWSASLPRMAPSAEGFKTRKGSQAIP